MTEKINTFLFGMEFLGTLLCSLILWIDRHRKGANTRLMVLSCIMLAFIAYQVLIKVMFRFGVLSMSIETQQGTTITNLTAVPLGAVILRELTNSFCFDFKHIFLHFSGFIVLTVTYALCHIFCIEYCPIAFKAFLVFLAIYIIYNFILIIRSYRRYQEKIEDIYADIDGRELNWFNTIFALLLANCLRHIIVYVGFGEGVVVSVGIIFSTLLWCYFGYYIHWMRYSPALVNTEDQPIVETAPEGPANGGGKATESSNTADLEEAQQVIQRLQRALDSSNLIQNQDLTRDDLARAINIPQTKLSKAIRVATGQSLSVFITDYRMSMATRLLITSDDNIEQIIFKCGYNTRPPFYRAFQQRFGCTPKEFRTKERAHKRQNSSNNSIA